MDSLQSIERHLRLIPLSPELRQVMAVIRDRGGDAFVVGGALRDWAWQPQNHDPASVDWDLATNLSPDLMRDLAVRPHPGERFGTFLLGSHIEATIMRREAGYSDGRHPSEIEPVTSIERDLSRRDFTVNAFAFDGQQLRWVEGGLEDLRDRCLRAVGDASMRFQEDPLRMARLIRLMGISGAKADSSTWRAMQLHRSSLKQVSRERRLEEFVKFLRSPLDRWPLWRQAGMDDALDWPSPIPESSSHFVAAPSHPAAKIAAYFLSTNASLADLDRWTRRWPLPRSWGSGLRALLKASCYFDPDLWSQRARGSREPYVWIFRDLALAAGVAEDELDPVYLDLSSHELQEGWGLHGQRLGAALGHLHGMVAVHPDWNHRQRLVSCLEAWLNETGGP